MVIDVKLVAPLNTLSPILLRVDVSTKVIDVKPVYWNAPLPILVILDGMVIDFKLFLT
jgi:hypothetical protein